MALSYNTEYNNGGIIIRIQNPSLIAIGQINAYLYDLEANYSESIDGPYYNPKTTSLYIFKWDISEVPLKTKSTFIYITLDDRNSSHYRFDFSLNDFPSDENGRLTTDGT